MSKSMDLTKKYKQIYRNGYDYLLSFDEITNDIIQKHLEQSKSVPKDMSSLLRRLLASSINKQGMSNSIGNLDDIQKILFDFNPSKIVQKFNNWEDIFDKIKEEYIPPGKMEKNAKTYWGQFCKTILSGANFVSKFDDITEFNNFIDQFNYNEYTKLSLPMLLSYEIYGFGFALACDFLKECGYTGYVKPDVHIKEIFNGIGISNSKDDYEIFKDVIKYADRIGEDPYYVDRIFWLIGSGKFFLDGIKINTKRDDFIRENRL